MSGQFLEFDGITVYLVSADGPELGTGKDAVDLMSAASEHRAEFIAIPAERLGDGFFELRTRIAGEFFQKFVTYGRRVAIIGDISPRTALSKSLASLVVESNRGKDLWFVNSLEDLGHRLSALEDSGDPGS